MSLLKKLPSWCGPLFPLVVFFIATLCWLGLFRLGLILWKWDRVQAVAGLWPVLGFGLRMDILFLCMLMALPVLLVLLLPARAETRNWPKLQALWLACYGAFLVFMEIATPPFINEYDTRPNRIFVEYLDHPREVFSTIWAEHAWPLIIAVLAVALTFYVTYRVLFAVIRQVKPWTLRQRLAMLPVIVLFMFLGARSSFDHRPANPSTAAFSKDHLVNQLGLSSGYSVLYAVYALQHESGSSDLYGKLSREKVLRHIRNATGYPETAFTNDEIPTLRRQEVSLKRARPLNLVIILEESLGASFVASLGGLPVTPELEKLSSRLLKNSLYK